MNRSTVRGMKLGAIFVVGSVALAGCGGQAVNESKKFTAKGNELVGHNQWQDAIEQYDKALDEYKDNHAALYGKGYAHFKKNEFVKSVDAFTDAVKIAPEQPIYQLWLGMSLYEKAVAEQTKRQADAEGKKTEDVAVDLTGVSFDTALQHLLESAKLNADMWHAHYYLGRIYRATDKPKQAAEEFTKAIQSNPREPGSYIALGELYRRWDYTDAALKVAQQGVQNVVGQGESSDIWYVLGASYDDKAQYKEAIDAYTKALDARKDNHKAKFQRGQAYFRLADYPNAKRDLEEFAKGGGSKQDFNKQLATKMIMDIAAKTSGEKGAGGGMKSPEDVVKGAKGGAAAPPKKK
jgi:tetratricopeptide (TPR) repeat protein